MHDAAQFIGARLSSHAKRETGAHDSGLGGEWGDPIRASGRGVAIQTETEFDVILCFVLIGRKNGTVNLAASY